MRALVGAFPAASERWLAVEAAEELVNGLLPGRPYEESLYRTLVVEGVLVQEVSHTRPRREGREIVFIAYDRLADHLIAEALLGAHFDATNARAAFGPGGGLAEVAEGGYETQGVLEALCIQLPERTGCEVVDLVPHLAQAEGFERAFTQSLVWRDVGTFSERTCDLVRTRLEPTRQDFYTNLGVLLTLATTAGSPPERALPRHSSAAGRDGRKGHVVVGVSAPCDIRSRASEETAGLGSCGVADKCSWTTA